MSTRRALLLAVENEMARQRIDRDGLARELGCTVQNVDQMLDPDRSGMRLGTAERLAKGLKCSLSLFLIPNILSEPLPEPAENIPRPEPEAPIHASVDQLCRWEDAARTEGLSLDDWMAFAAELAWNLFHREHKRPPDGTYSPLIAAFWMMQGLSPKAAHALGLAKVRTWDQLQCTELLKIPQLGKVGVRHVEALLARRRQDV